MEDFQNKDSTILSLLKFINNEFGNDYFEPIDYWEADLFAIGLKKAQRLIYISTWDFRNLDSKNMKHYSEFEILNNTETQEIYKTFNEIDAGTLLIEMKQFLNVLL